MAAACSAYSEDDIDDVAPPSDGGADVAPSDVSSTADVLADAGLFASRVVNASCRVDVTTRAAATFVLDGIGTKRIGVRALGPTLKGFGVANAMDDPSLRIEDATGKLIAENDDWSSGTSSAEVANAMLAPSHPKEAAVVASIPAGTFRIVVSGADASQGVVVVEIYDLDGEAPSSTRIASFSARGTAADGDGALIGGLIMRGDTPVPLLVRALGPSLSADGFANAIADPLLEARDDKQQVLHQNDDWGASGDRDAIAATAAAPTDPRESAVLAALGAGGYTLLVRAKDGGSGVAVVDFVDLRRGPP